MNVDFDDIRVFLQVVEVGGITAAAARLNVSKSILSSRLTRLEKSLDAALLYGESADVVSAERWDALWQSNYQLSSKFYAFGAVRYEHDMFDDFQYQGSGTLGIGYLVLNSKSAKLTVQLGGDYTLSRPETLTTPYIPPG